MSKLWPSRFAARMHFLRLCLKNRGLFERVLENPKAGALVGSVLNDPAAERLIDCILHDQPFFAACVRRRGDLMLCADNALPAPPDETDPRKAGVTPELRARYADIVEEPFWEIAHKCLPYTMLLVERLYDIYKAIEYVCRHNIEGDIVECGVALGGAVMTAAETLVHFQSTERKVYLYDTFAGMTPPGAHDFDLFGNDCSTMDPAALYWTDGSLYERTRKNLRLCRYPYDRFVFVKGPVEETLPGVLPDKIAYLRLDTDFYEPTKQELVHLFPRLVPGGVITIDDYGHYLGARKATDEYFATCPDQVLLHRVDYTGRTGVKLVSGAMAA
ncbi:MAG TPA: TylF/MycF/NovP-related O-methyltransferase [Pirellulales bacterium]|nr:TylF/MycF/NovP-related O-methyltransferase [Pirellulales bacterium]